MYTDVPLRKELERKAVQDQEKGSCTGTSMYSLHTNTHHLRHKQYVPSTYYLTKECTQFLNFVLSTYLKMYYISQVYTKYIPVHTREKKACTRARYRFEAKSMYRVHHCSTPTCRYIVVPYYYSIVQPVPKSCRKRCLKIRTTPSVGLAFQL